MAGRGFLNWDFYYNYINHPLIPPSIAAKLKKFRLTERGDIRFTLNKPNKTFVCIYGLKGGPPDKGYTRLFHQNGEKLDINPVVDFYNNCNSLKNAIAEWLDKMGIRDINLLPPDM